MQNTSRNNKMKLLALALILPISALACSLILPSSHGIRSSMQPTAIQATNSSSQTLLALPPALLDEEDVLIQLYKAINPAVVNITTYVQHSGEELRFVQGTGFVYDLAGDIITNAHVVQGADEIEVTFSDGTIRPADLVGLDLHSDLAVVNVVSLPSEVYPIPLGNLDEVEVGQTVVAIGNPFGLEGTLTRGIVSAIGRSIPTVTSFSIPLAIQTDAPINPGNSGGPLLNLKGEVIGVNAQIETDGTSSTNSGVGFAIPVSIVQRVVPELIMNNHYDWPWLGVRGGNLNPTVAKAMNLPIEKGAYLSEIVTGGPAEKASLQGIDEVVSLDGRSVGVGGDVITAIDGQPLNSFDEMLIYIAMNTSPGQEVTLTILRDGQYKDVVIILEPRPDSLPLE
jgi:S1-C subfamily serine protease